MKNNKFYYNIKSPFIILLMVCAGNIAKAQNNTVLNVLKQIDSLSVCEKIDIAKKNIEAAHRDNIYSAGFAATNYIQQHIDNKDLSDFMMHCIASNANYYYWPVLKLIIPQEMILDIKKNYKWFDNLMKYLSGQINDKEFYNTGFFSTICEPTYGFYANLYLIERCSGFIERNKCDTINFYDGMQR